MESLCNLFLERIPKNYVIVARFGIGSAITGESIKGSAVRQAEPTSRAGGRFATSFPIQHIWVNRSTVQLKYNAIFITIQLVAFCDRKRRSV